MGNLFKFINKFYIRILSLYFIAIYIMNKTATKVFLTPYVLYGASVVQFGMSMGSGFSAETPFNCAVATIGIVLSMTLAGLNWKGWKTNLSSRDLALHYQGYCALSHLSSFLGMLFVYIYSQGACEDLVEGCDENTTSITMIILQGFLAIMFTSLFFIYRHISDRRRNYKTTFKVLYIISLVLGTIAYTSGYTGIDGGAFITSMGVFVLAAGISTTMIVFEEARRSLWYVLVLLIQCIISIIIFGIGFSVEDEEGFVMRNEVLATQLISMVTLMFVTIFTFLSIKFKWEGDVLGRGLSQMDELESNSVVDSGYDNLNKGKAGGKRTISDSSTASFDSIDLA